CRLTPDVVRSVRQALGALQQQYPEGDVEDEEEGGDCGGGGSGDQQGERLDLLYLDCTFADLPLEFPSREEAVRQAVQLIRRRTTPTAPCSSSSSRLSRVYLSSDLLGTEALCGVAGGEFGQPLYVCPPELHREYGFANAELVRQRREELSLLLPQLRLSDDPTCLFHLCGVRDFAHRGSRQQQQQPGCQKQRKQQQQQQQRKRPLSYEEDEE
ncbi:hypothetical protein Agub_g9998, partial [Astrephomene gubernaculifera]